MAQKSGNNQKKHTEYSQTNNKKTEAKDVPETPIKKNMSYSQAQVLQDLSPVPFPPKTDYANQYIFGSNYSYSSDYVEINTPIVQQPQRLITDQPAIVNKIIFQSQGQDGPNNSSSMQSSDSDDNTPSDSFQNSENEHSPSVQSEQEGSGQPSQNLINAFQKQVKIRNRPTKSRNTSNQSKQINPNKKVFCNCKKTKCLKLYCDCFRLNQTCQGCNCVGCHNLQIYSEERNNAILALMDRNPDPFGQKIEDDKHVKGCNCKKSNCLKKYCECYQAGLKCGQNCKCQECKNMPIQKGGPQADKGAALAKNTAKKQRKMVEI